MKRYPPGTDPYEPRTDVDLYSEVAPRIMLPENLPYISYGIGIARSGTTVSLNFMGASVAEDDQGHSYPILSGYQHFKAGYRQAMHGWPSDARDTRWEFRIPDARQVPVFNIKDPLGPYTRTESVYNPLTLLKMIGYPQDKLSLVFFFRDPQEVLTSWKRNWGKVRDEDILRENLITSCHSLRSIHQEAVQDGYDTHMYLYEALRDNPAKQVVQTLFDGVNAHLYPRTGYKIKMTDRTVGDWDPEDIGRIWHPDEPAIYTRAEISDLHHAAKSKQRLEYKKYSEEDLRRILTPQDISELELNHVYDDYEYFREEYMRSTGLPVLSPEGIRVPSIEGRMRQEIY